MQCIAPGAELKLNQKGPEVALQRKPDRRTAVEGDKKSRRGNP
jgi:hypothetical protein